ncbi:MAG: Gfo/Idh/MocA family oxidoreductase [Gemmataceae bacterium]
MTRLRLAVIGVGHLGKEHARILSGLADVDLVGVADVNEAQARSVAAKLHVQAYGDYRLLPHKIDAACVVVPTSLHEQVAADLLRRGIPALVEKPLASTRAGAETLVELSHKHNTILQVGHIERFNPAFEEAVRRNLRPWFLRAERLGPFSGRSSDTGVVLDLMIHDLDLILTLVGRPVESVEARGVRVFGRHEDVVQARIRFAGGSVAEVLASRAHPQPARQMHAWSDEGYAHLDFGQRRATFVAPSVDVMERGLDVSRLEPEARARLRDDLFTRHLPLTTVDGQAQDQLTAELRHFVDCVRTGKTPRVTGENGLESLALAERILDQIHCHSWRRDLRQAA